MVILHKGKVLLRNFIIVYVCCLRHSNVNDFLLLFLISSYKQRGKDCYRKEMYVKMQDRLVKKYVFPI